MSAPVLQILYRRDADIFFGWAPLSKTEAKSYNIYSCSSATGIFTLLLSNISNTVDKAYRNKVCALIKDADIPIPGNSRYYFKLTYVNLFDIESDISLSVVTTVYPPHVNFHYEGEASEANNHNFAWSETNQRWEKTLISADGKIEVVTSEGPSTIQCFNSYNESLDVVYNVETTILSYTNSKEYYLHKIVCSGTADAVFYVKINSSIIETLRNSWNNRNVVFDFSEKSFCCNSDDIVTVTALHKEINSQDYNVSLFGHTF
ncbi:MAG: hypothetical protein PHF86_07515 [Candidatus Nanoarchaeia archaeon]|jgi:hypothetical protein|nr:hypothetical protein [Candidatus Nanoarchaeia archaeon]